MTAAADHDVFAAIADPRRRAILGLLAREGETPVSAIVVHLDEPQPAVSKHLALLRKAGVVAVRRQGRARIYSINAERLRAVHEWTRTFERFWTDHTERIRARAENPSSPVPPTQEPPR
jgi:DNA-binding transcriptional ArsR family regulator